MKDTSGTSWPRKKLGSLCSINRGSSPRPIADIRYFEGGTVPWVKIADATKSEKFLYETKQHVNDFGASFSRRLPPGTILVAASGTLGYTQILGVEGCAHDGWLIIQELQDLDRDFLYYVLKTLEQHFFASASGAAIQNINTDILRETVIPHPPLPTQRKIAGVLSAYDDLIENNLRRIKILEEMAQSLYREWFVHFRFPGDESVPLVDSPLVDSPLGAIPEGWVVKKLADVAAVNAETIRPKIAPGEITYIDIASVSTGSVDNAEPMHFADAPSRARRIVRHGDVIWSTVRPNRRSFALILDPVDDLVVSTGFAVLSPRTVPSSYLYQAVTTDDFTSYLVNHATGAAYPAVNASIFEAADILVPPGDLLERFDSVVGRCLSLRASFQRRNQVLRQTRDLLLPKLLSA